MLDGQIEVGAAIQAELTPLIQRAKRVTFFNYISKSSEAILPDHLLKMALPDFDTALRARSVPNMVTSPIEPQRAVQNKPSAPAITASGEPNFVCSDQIFVNGLWLTNPMIYVADCASYPHADASLLCLRRMMDNPRAEPPKALGYWPQMSDLLPHQVGNYVRWLADGRKDPEMDLGYVFLYFYGLERRALVDNQDILPIAYEALRLLSIYSHSNSFRTYVTSFFCYLVMLGRIQPSVKLIDRLLQYQDRFIDEWLWMVIVGHLARSSEALPVEWARRLAAQDERARQSVFIERQPDDFARIFGERYASRFGTGLIPATSGQIKLHYRAASPTLLQGTSAHKKIPQVTWPQILNWRDQFAPVIEVWNESVGALKELSKSSKSGVSTSIVTQDANIALQDSWGAFLNQQNTTHAGCLLVPISQLATFTGIAPRSRLTLTQSKAVAMLAESLGTPLEPDVRYTGKTYAWDAHVAVLRLPDATVLPQGKAYAVAAVIARLALEVAQKDGVTTLDERHTILTFLEERFMLGPNERRRLSALLDVCLQDKPSLAGTVKSIESVFNDAQRQAVGRFLVDVATASDGVARSEISALERVFKQMGLETALVMSFVRDTIAATVEKPVRAQEAIATASEPIPPPEAIDIERIRKLRAESDEVSKMLVAAMEETPIKEDINANVISNTPKEPLKSNQADKLVLLHGSLRAVVREFTTKEEWPRGEADALARRNGTTLAAAIEQINEWSDEHLGDFLLEDDDGIRVRAELLKGVAI